MCQTGAIRPIHGMMAGRTAPPFSRIPRFGQFEALRWDTRSVVRFSFTLALSRSRHKRIWQLVDGLNQTAVACLGRAQRHGIGVGTAYQDSASPRDRSHNEEPEQDMMRRKTVHAVPHNAS